MTQTFSRVSRRATITAVLLFCGFAAPAAADQITHVSLAFPISYFQLNFGSGMGEASTSFPQTFRGQEWLEGRHGGFPLRDTSTLEMTTGPLIDFVKDIAFDRAEYHYAPGGFLNLALDLDLPDGTIHHGTFTAPFAGLIMFAENNRINGGGYFHGELGAGQFDHRTARLLGIYPRTLPSPLWELYADMHDDTWDEPRRFASLNGTLRINAIVPEPSLLGLAGMALMAAWMRQRRRGRVR